MTSYQFFFEMVEFYQIMRWSVLCCSQIHLWRNVFQVPAKRFWMWWKFTKTVYYRTI